MEITPLGKRDSRVPTAERIHWRTKTNISVALKEVGAYPRVKTAKQENKCIHCGIWGVLFCSFVCGCFGFFLEVGEWQRERENVKQAPGPVQSPMWGSISRP